MTIAAAFLALLDVAPRHGYEMKRAYDRHFARERPLHYGQVYATLSRLLKNGLIEVAGVEPGSGPDRKRYAITESGVADVQRWLDEPEDPAAYLNNALFMKVVSALLTGRSANAVLDAQRLAHLRAMRELTRRKLSGDLTDQLICDHALMHLEADMRWLELTVARLDALSARVRA
ncbi:PadR family transcriptional regulator [Micromonospora chokoriensis]